MLHTNTVIYVVSKSKMMKSPQQEVTGDEFETHGRGLKIAYLYSADLGRHFTRKSNSPLTLKETPARSKHGSGLSFTTVFIMQMDREINVMMRSSLLSDSLRMFPVTLALQELI